MSSMFQGASSFNQDLSSWNPAITGCDTGSSLISDLECSNFDKNAGFEDNQSKMPQGINT
jgi:hypothetical protein